MHLVGGVVGTVLIGLFADVTHGADGAVTSYTRGAGRCIPIPATRTAHAVKMADRIGVSAATTGSAPDRQPVRGIGEPIREARRGAAIIECPLHEPLVTTAVPPVTAAVPVGRGDAALPGAN